MSAPLGRRSTVVASWLVFTAVATGVGLAAVELVSDPILEQSLAGNGPPAGVAATPGGGSATGDGSLPGGSPSSAGTTTTATGRPTPTASPTQVPSATSTRPSPSSSTADRTAAPRRGATISAPRTVRTEAGSVTARCVGASGRLTSWSPAPGWRVHGVDPGPDDSPKVDFEGEGGEVRVEFRCSGGRPVSSVERSD